MERALRARRERDAKRSQARRRAERAEGSALRGVRAGRSELRTGAAGVSARGFRPLPRPAPCADPLRRPVRFFAPSRPPCGARPPPAPRACLEALRSSRRGSGVAALGARNGRARRLAGLAGELPRRPSRRSARLAPISSLRSLTVRLPREGFPSGTLLREAIGVMRAFETQAGGERCAPVPQTPFCVSLTRNRRAPPLRPRAPRGGARLQFAKREAGEGIGEKGMSPRIPRAPRGGAHIAKREPGEGFSRCCGCPKLLRTTSCLSEIGYALGWLTRHTGPTGLTRQNPILRTSLCFPWSPGPKGRSPAVSR